MALTTNIQNLATRIATEMKSLRTLINGNAADLSALNTVNKTNLVSAINEVAAASGAAPATLTDLTDVMITTPASGQALIWDGTQWVNDDVAAPIPDASDTVKGIVELATDAEAATGTDTTRAVTPANIKPLLDAKASSSSLSAVAFSGSAADLTGTLPASSLPPLAISSVSVVADQAAMLALDAQEGDIAKRTDTNRTYILAASPATTLSNWIEVSAGGDVQSVAGKTGHVTLVKGDVGLGNVDNTSDADKPISTATQTALNGKQDADAALTSISGLTIGANQMLYTTGVDTFATTAISSVGRDLLGDSTVAAMRTRLDVYSKTEIGNPETNFVTTFEAGLV